MRLGPSMALTRRQQSGGAPPSLLADYTYILPGSGDFGGDPTEEIRSFNLLLEPPGAPNTFTNVRVRLGNTGPAYTIDRCYLMRAGNSNPSVTEDATTGVVTVSASPVTIAAGTLNSPSWTWLHAGSISMGGPVSELRLLIQAAADAPECSWGSGSRPGIGWIYTHSRLNQNLTDGISFSGQESYGMMPPISVMLEGLSTPVCTLFTAGDSWYDGYGDGDQPRRPHGFQGRLNSRWWATSQPVAPLMFARVGFTTPQTVERLQNLVDNFDVRACLLQFNSLNNITQGLPTSTPRDNWMQAEAIMGARKLLPMPAGGGGLVDYELTYWPQWASDIGWIIARRPDTIMGAYTRLVSLETGVIGDGLSYPPGSSHPGDLGYDYWEEDIHADIRAALAGWGV